MIVKSCFFIGHREESEEIYADLRAAVEQHIVEFGVTEFIVGQYGGFDKLAVRAVIDAKKTHPEVTLTLLLQYHPAERPMAAPEGFDGTYYPPGACSPPCSHRQSQPVYGRSCGLSDCLCVASCQQRTETGGVCQKKSQF